LSHPAAPYAVNEDGVTLVVRLTPRAAKEAIHGLVALPDGRTALAVRVAAPPVEGAANAALVALLAKRLGVRKADITLAAGDTARLKRLVIRGDGVRIATSLKEMLGRG
jgi:uncharacterized protein (TIGR00251 family)